MLAGRLRVPQVAGPSPLQDVLGMGSGCVMLVRGAELAPHQRYALLVIRCGAANPHADADLLVVLDATELAFGDRLPRYKPLGSPVQTRPGLNRQPVQSSPPDVVPLKMALRKSAPASFAFFRSSPLRSAPERLTPGPMR